MSTKTMRLPPRRVLTPSNNNNNKCKEEEQQQQQQQNGEPDAVKQSTAKKPKMEPAQTRVGSAPSNQLLAGYLAHEFLTKGTLFGEQWNPAASASEPKPEERAEPRPERLQRYVAIADLMGVDGSHLAGVVNPAQLAWLLQL